MTEIGNRTIGVFLARFSLGLMFFMTGVYRIFEMGVIQHARRFFVEPYADTFLPVWSLWLAGTAVPFMEFIGGGLMLVGAVNLLCLDPHAPPSLRQLCIAANLGTVAFAAALVATATGSATPAQSLSERFGDPQLFLVFALALGASWLSRSRRVDSARPPV